jgi:type VI secretion system ImpM family protein
VPAVAVTPLFFGKLPNLGDFVARGMLPSCRDRIDDWLSGEMAAARADSESDFAERYDVAPSWNFVVRDGDDRWLGGMLCASCDRAGRRYPLLLAAPAPDAATAAMLSQGCVELVELAFTDAWDADRIERSPVEPKPTVWQPQDSEWALFAEEGPVMILHGDFPEGVVAGMVRWAQ